MPAQAVHTSGVADEQTVHAARVSGRLVLDHKECFIVNPLLAGAEPPAVDAKARLVLLEAALAVAPHRVDLQVEYVRAIVHEDEPSAARIAARICRHARTAGATVELVATLTERSMAARFLELCRYEVLCCFIEAGWTDSVSALLLPEERGLRGRIACRQHRYAEAIAEVAGVQGAEACIVRARAALSLNDHRTCTEAITAFDRYPASFSQTLEQLLLRHRQAVIRQDAQSRDQAAAALEVLASKDGDPYLAAHVESGLIRAAMFVGDVPSAERHLAALKRMVAQLPSPSVKAMIQYSEALIGTLTGNYPRLAATVQGDPGDVLSPGFARWQMLSALENALRGEVRTALEIMRQLPMHSLRVEFCLLLGRLQDAQVVIEQLGEDAGGPMGVMAGQLRRLRGEPIELVPASSHVHQIFVYRSLLNARLRMDADDFAGADKICEQALRRVEQFQIWEPGIQAWILRADLAARQGNSEEALALLDRAEAFQMHPACFNMNLIAAARSVLTDQPPTASMLSRLAQQGDYRSIALLHGAGVPLPAGATRLLSGLHPHALHLAVRRFQVATTSDAVLVETEARWFRMPHGQPVSLARYGSTRRILVALTEARLTRTGSHLDPDALIEAGWPGERILPLTAQTRLYTAIRKLRKLGLGAVLETTSDGYRLAPHIPVSRVRARIDQAASS